MQTNSWQALQTIFRENDFTKKDKINDIPDECNIFLPNFWCQSRQLGLLHPGLAIDSCDKNWEQDLSFLLFDKTCPLVLDLKFFFDVTLKRCRSIMSWFRWNAIRFNVHHWRFKRQTRIGRPASSSTSEHRDTVKISGKSAKILGLTANHGLTSQWKRW